MQYFKIHIFLVFKITFASGTKIKDFKFWYQD